MSILFDLNEHPFAVETQCVCRCSRQIRWGAGPGPVAVDREVAYSDMTDWRRFGRAPASLKGR